MTNEKATLKDIAAALGVSATTVHRALNGRGGVSTQMREQVKALAAQMGYSTNMAAAALKRHELRIGVLLPEPTLENRFYYAALWSGIEKFMEENGTCNARIIDFSYPLLPGYHGERLRELYENHLSEIDGLITLGVEHNQSSYFMEKISHSGIPCIVLGSNLYPESCLCCVKACDHMSGRLAAELLTTFLPTGFQGNIILTGNPSGASAMVDQFYNLKGFEDYIKEQPLPMGLYSIYCADTSKLKNLLDPLLTKQNALPYAAYASSARHTVQLCRIISELGLTGQIKLIGNDRFPESLEFLKSGCLTALIDKKISQQAYTGASILLEYLTRNQYPASSVVEIPPEIIMRGSLE